MTAQTGGMRVYVRALAGRRPGDRARRSTDIEPDHGPNKGIVGRSPWQIARGRLRRDKVAFTAFLAVCFAYALAIAAPVLQAAGVLDPYAFHNDLIGGLGSLPLGHWGGISTSHPFGVEPGTGRGVFSRVILGLSLSLLIATLATLISLVLGVILGVISAYMGRYTDFWISRSMDLVLSFPQTLMLLALSPVLKPRLTQAGMPSGTAHRRRLPDPGPGFLRLALHRPHHPRSGAEPAQPRVRRGGAEPGGQQTAYLGQGTDSEPVGADDRVRVADPAAEHRRPRRRCPTSESASSRRRRASGTILNNSVSYYSADPAFFYIPGAVLVLIVLSFNMFGDGLRDALDPKSMR